MDVPPTRRATVWLTVAVAVQLVLSPRFFFKYVDPLPGAAYAAYVALGLLAWMLVLRSPRVLGLLGSRGVLGVGLAVLTGMVAVAYPRADALRAVKRGSDQDDCVRALVDNVVALRAPYGMGYFGDPCSTGPGELVPYLPVAVWGGWFVVVPALVVLLGYRVLTLVADPSTAVVLSLTQLVSWLFLELSATGSDLPLIAWLFASGVVATTLGLLRRNRLLTLGGGVAYLLFATSRLPLLVVAAASMVVVLLVVGRRAWLVVAPVLVLAVAAYAGTYALAPDRFRPGHLAGKSLRILVALADDPMAQAAAVVVVLAGSAAVVLLRHSIRFRVVRAHWGAHVAVVTLPMAAVCLWDLRRQGHELAAWEGLHYLFLGVPMLLVLAAVGCLSQTPAGKGTPVLEWHR